MDKAGIERLNQLVLAAQGMPTKRPVAEILASERKAASQYIARSPAGRIVQQQAREGVSE